MVFIMFRVMVDSSVSHLRVRILRSCVLCEMKDSYDILRESFEVSVYDAASMGSVIEAGHHDVLQWCSGVSEYDALNSELFLESRV